jgi:hypothetical protein
VCLSTTLSSGPARRGKVLGASKNGAPSARLWTKGEVPDLKVHSKAKTLVEEVAKAMDRTVFSLREKARRLGIGLGRRR